MPKKVQRKRKQVIKQKQNVTQKVIVNVPIPKLRRGKTQRKKTASVAQIPPVAGLTGYLPVSKKPDTEAWQKLNKSSVTVEDITEKPKMIEYVKQLQLEHAKDNEAMKQLIYRGAEQIQQALNKQRPQLIEEKIPKKASKKSSQKPIFKQEILVPFAEAYGEEESKLEDVLQEHKEDIPSQQEKEISSSFQEIIGNIESAMQQPEAKKRGGYRPGAGRPRKNK